MSAKQNTYILAFTVPLLFLLIALLRLYPFENTLQQIIADSGNDWSKYASNALDIKHNGLLMPGIEGAYEKPASFFYCYFLALCFFMFGENNVPVYLLQNLMLGLSVVFIWLSFREKMSRTVSLVFLFALLVMALTDVSIYYTFRFLGENLALFSLSVFFLLFSRGWEKDKLPAVLVAALFLGIAVLTRPNIFLFALVLIVLLLLSGFKTQKAKPLLLFVTVLLITSSFLAIRNYLVCHCIQFMPSQGMLFNMIAFHPVPASVDVSQATSYFDAYLQYFLQQPFLFIMHYVNKVLFCFGFLNAVEPAYHWFPHWTLMWLGYFTYLFLLFRNKYKAELPEKAVHLFIFTYFASLVLVGQVENYGFRMLIPGNFFVLAFAFMALDKLIPLLKKKSVVSP
ncbi:MAG: glycosyltransferase family 39 protein [Bacteroidia bacterium]